MCYKQIMLIALCLAVLDGIFLSFLGPLFGKMVKKIQGSDMKVNIISTLVTYCVMVFQIYYFVIKPKISLMVTFSSLLIDGGVLGKILSWALPNGVVKDFFLTSLTYHIGGLTQNEVGVIVIDLSIIVIKFGLSMSFNFTSVIGLATAYYILRYFR